MSDELTREEQLAVTLAQFDLERHSLTQAINSLVGRAQKIGTSGLQKAVLFSDLEEVVSRCASLNKIKWPTP